MASLGELLARKRQVEEKTNREVATTLTPSVAGALGKTIGDNSAGIEERRGKSLRQLINQGKLDPADLGPNDASLVGSGFLKHFEEVDKPGDSGGGFLGGLGPVGEAVGNFANEAVDFGKGLPGGLFEAGKSAGEDVGHAVAHPTTVLPNYLSLFSPASIAARVAQGENPLEQAAPNVSKNIIDPTIKAYKEKYTQGSPGEILKRATIEEPFGTALDIGTLATGGAGALGKGGEIASNIGEGLEAANDGEGALGRLGTAMREKGNYFKQYGYKGTRGTRPDLDIGTGGNNGVTREYGTSPIVRLGQRLADKHLEDVPVVGQKLSDWRKTEAIRKLIRTDAGRERMRSSFNAAIESKPVHDAVKDLTNEESAALHLLKNGVNDQAARPRGGVARGNVSMIDSFSEYLDKAHEGALPPGFNIADMPGVDPEYNRGLKAAVDDPKVRELVSNPTPEMINASDVWDQQVEKNLESHGITAEEHDQRRWAPQEALRATPDDLADAENAAEIQSIKDPAGAFQRFSDNTEGGQFPIEPNYIPHSIAEGTYSGDIYNVERPPHDERIRLAEENGKRHPNYLSPNELKAFLSGAMRVDQAPLAQHIALRERMLAHNGLFDDFGKQFGVKDGNGETIKVQDDSEMKNRGFSPKDYVALDLDGVKAYHQGEVSFLDQMVKTVQAAMGEAPKDLANKEPQIMQSLDDFVKDDAQKASLKISSMSTPKKTVVPREAARYFKETLDSMTPEAHKAFRYYDKMLNGWRSALLAASPRWWINTFVGSAFLTGLAGAARPRYFGAALRYGKGEMAARIVKRWGDDASVGKIRKTVANAAEDNLGSMDRAAKLMEAAPEYGVGGLYGGELGDTELTHGKGIRGHHPARAAFHKVDSMESLFKRAGLFHQLDKQAKAYMHQVGEVMDDFHSMGKMSDEYIDNLLHNHPTMVSHAVDEANKFYYNYTSLGPFERRWIRRAVPFWGWYKFITRLMYQLPWQYPARTNVLSKLSNVANEFEENELGILPPSIVGSIFLNKDRSNLQYIPTYGLNPFSDFANPAAPEGTMAGLLANNQLSPVIQAFMKSAGIDPYSGGSEELSPEMGLLEGRFGKVIDPKTGEEIPGGLGSAGSGERFLGGLLGSVPQLGTLDTILNHGRYTYADSIPLLDDKPEPVEEGEAYGDGGTPWEYALRSILGAAPSKTINAREYQQGLQEEREQGESHKKSQLKALRKAGVR